MFVLLKKELNVFLNSLMGYIVMVLFLIVSGFFLWIEDGDSNIVNTGYASLYPLFVIAPWLMMFLIPALTMRSFSEEYRTGTIELLLTRPISDLKIIGAKFLAGVALVAIALLPTLVYFHSVYYLGEPIGNIDTGEVLGSYLGLLLLSSVYVSIGIFASSLTNNQIIAFIVSIFICFIFYMGFDAFSDLLYNTGLDYFFQSISINEHYLSISRGVLDTRDLFYFVGVTLLFLLATDLKLKSRKW
jgi:ABC-2 type transport system permease protein